jgi:hypothetical protein
MDRLLGTIVGLVILVIALPTIAVLAQGALPALVSLVVLLGFVRLLLPPRSRRRQS